ncbi:MAG: type III secretion system cytoplasmic ring protein SctQ [Verrucomicrobiota bacterium]
MSVAVPKISSEVAKLESCLATLAGEIPLTLGGEMRSVRLSAEREARGNSGVCLPLSLDGKLVSLQLAGEVLTKQQQAEAGIVDFEALPADLAALFIERHFSEDLDRFERWSGRKLSSTSRSADEIEIPFTVSGGIGGTICAEEGAAELLLEIFKRLPRAETDLSEQSISLSIELGRTSLSLADLEPVTSRDVILIEQGPEILSGKVELRPSPDLLFKATLSETQITINEIMNTGTDEPPHEEDAKIEVGEIPVELVFELGRQQIVVSELSQIQPGAVLPLEDPIDAAVVTIRANGRVFGKGELVQVGDRIGVRLQ